MCEVVRFTVCIERFLLHFQTDCTDIRCRGHGCWRLLLASSIVECRQASARPDAPLGPLAPRDECGARCPRTWKLYKIVQLLLPSTKWPPYLFVAYVDIQEVVATFITYHFSAAFNTASVMSLMVHGNISNYNPTTAIFSNNQLEFKLIYRTFRPFIILLWAYSR